LDGEPAKAFRDSSFPLAIRRLAPGIAMAVSGGLEGEVIEHSVGGAVGLDARQRASARRARISLRTRVGGNGWSGWKWSEPRVRS
jgi:hypothetical protein